MSKNATLQADGTWVVRDFTAEEETDYAAMKASSELMNAFSLFTKKYDDIEEFSLKINDRFSSDKINDELVRIARNPKIKFSENERFAKPLDILIQNDQYFFLIWAGNM